MNDLEVLHGKFDADLHKNTFIDYLEVVISPDGTVEYAVPSHVEKLIKVCENRDNISREDVFKRIPESDAPIDALTKYTGYISVWDRYIVGNPNERQVATLKKLKLHGLYKGTIPTVTNRGGLPMKSSKFKIWFCTCGRIHFVPMVEFDWLEENCENNRIFEVCRNCGAIRETYLTPHYEYDLGVSTSGYDINSWTYDNEDVIIFEHPMYTRLHHFYFRKGIKVPMVEGGYADCHRGNKYYNSQYMTSMGYSSDISYTCEYPNCIKVDTEKLIKEIKRDYSEFADDLLYSIIWYNVGIDWSGTKYNHK